MGLNLDVSVRLSGRLESQFGACLPEDSDPDVISGNFPGRDSQKDGWRQMVVFGNSDWSFKPPLAL